MFRIDKRLVSYSNAEFAKGVYTDVGTDIRAGGAGGGEQKLKKENDAARALLEDAKKQAEELLNEARLEAEEVLETARAEAAALREAAKREGFENGYEKGSKEAKGEAEEKSRKELETIRNILGKIGDERDAVIDSLEDEMIDLILEISRKVINVQLEKDDKTFVEMLKNALASFKRAGKLVIRVGPEEYERLFSSGVAEFLIDHETVRATVTEEPHFNKGDCVLESDGETVNAGVDSQLRYVALAFRGREDSV